MPYGSLVGNIDGRILIAVMGAAARGTRPHPVIEFQIIMNAATPGTALAGGEEPADLDQRPPRPILLVLAKLKELRPAGIIDRPGQTMIANQSLDMQVFNSDVSVLVY